MGKNIQTAGYIGPRTVRKLKQLEFKLEKIIGIRNIQEKVENYSSLMIFFQGQIRISSSVASSFESTLCGSKRYNYNFHNLWVGK